jgi:hypothetical protein
VNYLDLGVEPDKHLIIGERYLILSGPRTGEQVTCWKFGEDEEGYHKIILDGHTYPVALLNPPLAEGDRVVIVQESPVKATAVEDTENEFRFVDFGEPFTAESWVACRSVMVGAAATSRTNAVMRGLLSAAERHGYESSAEAFVEAFSDQLGRVRFTPRADVELSLTSEETESAREMRSTAHTALSRVRDSRWNMQFPSVRVMQSVNVDLAPTPCKCREMTLQDIVVQVPGLRSGRIADTGWRIRNPRLEKVHCPACWFRED